MPETIREKKKIFLICGEVSGDLNGASLVRAVRELAPEFEFVGIGGEHLRSEGVRLLRDSSTWGSVGAIESLSRAHLVYPALRALPAMFRAEKPDLFVPIDYRFFNMRAARAAKAAGIPVMYYFAPVSWYGTGGKRFAELAQTVDLALLTLPFSIDDYRASGARFEFIGHPLVDTVRPELSAADAHSFYGTDPARPVVGLMPGSRYQEVKRLLPVFARAAVLYKRQFPEAQFLLFSATSALDEFIKQNIGDAPVSVVREKIYDFMNVCDFLIMCSGTAAHEATLMRKPMIVTYKISTLTNWLVRRTVNPPYIALPNIVAQRFVVPELLQEACTPHSLSQLALLLSDAGLRDTMKRELDAVAERMGAPGALKRAASLTVNAALGKFPEKQETTDKTK